jgi:hypothetical protein
MNALVIRCAVGNAYTHQLQNGHFCNIWVYAFPVPFGVIF